MRHCRSLLCWLAGLLLIAVLAIGIGTDIDIRISDRIYAWGDGAWPISHAGWIRQVAYEGAKYSLMIFALFLLAGAWRPALLRPLALERGEAIFVAVCLVVVPSLVALIKYHSGVSCAAELARYGGTLPDVDGHFRFSRLFAGGPPHGCWPSGHASGGFALFALGALPRPPATRLRLWCLGLGAGLVMGGYQVLRGAHFASHVAVTALIAQVLVCLLALAWARLA